MINLNTVRKVYGELEEEGYISTTREKVHLLPVNQTGGRKMMTGNVFWMS